jgi:predicted RND superfamily exporter protein
VFTLICAVLQFGVSVNYNIIEYLPEEAQSTRALAVMAEEFTESVPNARVMLKGVTPQQAIQVKNQLAALDGVSGVMWLDDVFDLRTPLEMGDLALIETYYKDGNALIEMTIAEGVEVSVTDNVYAIIGESNALSGEAVSRAAMQQTAVSETSGAMIILIPVIIVILLLTTESWLEPLLFLASIGLSIVMNMGTNLIFGKISFITNAISPILQLAVSLDYAIFLLHAFRQGRQTMTDTREAMRFAMKRAFSSVAASAATTLFGFIALMFMKFKIGSDLGIVLAKGIVLSFVSVMTFLPALTLVCVKLLDKTRHRGLIPSTGVVGKVTAKLRVPALILVLILLVPCFLAQSKGEFIYGSEELTVESRVGIDTASVDDVFGKSNPVVLLVPRGDVERERALALEAAELPHVTRVMSYATTVGDTIPVEFLDGAIISQFYSANYARIIIYTDTLQEGDDAFAMVESVQDTAREFYGDGYYALGASVNLWDMREVVQRDNSIVNYIAVGSILLVLLVTFRSITLPIFLILTIESAIWINLSVPYFAGTPLCYIGYLVISTVQLGATVDYAILLTDHYRLHRRDKPKRDAMRKTMDEVFMSIFVSALIMSLAGFTLGMTSTNPIVADMGILLGRGTILSFVLVICFTPAALVTFDKLIAKTTIGAKFLLEGKKK